MVLRLALAGACGAVVGAEREWRDRTAGFRTHILVCIGAAVFTIVSAYGFRSWYQVLPAGQRPNLVMDPARIAAQVVSGIGFLGAGAIFQSRGSVKGLTTAASLWAMAAIGMAIGAGDYAVGLTCTVLLVFVLTGLREVSNRIKSLHRQERAAVTIKLASERAMGAAFDVIAAHGARVAHLNTSLADDESFKRLLAVDVDLPQRTQVTDLVQKLVDVEGVTEVVVVDVDRA
jgi:putative Mg2+ transporter-C (MgtC) family protein